MSTPPPPEPGLSHVDARGRARMVDVSAKEATPRTATAEGCVELTAAVRAAVLDGTMPKGEVLAVARIAGIQAAKETSRLVPLCHPLPLEAVEIVFAPHGDAAIRIEATARCRWSTGVEMEAMTAVSVAALTIYDMCKAACRGASITGIRLLAKSGGRSGDWVRS